HRIAIAGAIAFAFQTAVLDAVVWPAYFRGEGAPPAQSGGKPLGGNDEIKPVYPRIVPPNPLAARLCEAFHELPAKRRAECGAQSAGSTLTSECVRTLSFAVNEKAVILDSADADRC